MVTIQRSNVYTNYAVKSFFENTKLTKDDEFFLINNDGCDLEKYYSNKKKRLVGKKGCLNLQYCQTR